MSDAPAPDYTPAIEQIRDLVMLGGVTAAHAQGRELDDAELGAMFDRALSVEITRATGDAIRDERERIARHVEETAPALYLRDPRDTLGALRETLREAQICLGLVSEWPDSEARIAEIIPHRERIERVIVEIDSRLAADIREGKAHA